MIISLIRGVTDTAITVADVKWSADFEDFLVSPNKNVGLWNAATFTDGVRKQTHVVEVRALVLDYDGKHGRAENVGAHWQHERLIHSTWSHTPEAPRLRVILPLKRPVNTDEYAALYTWAIERDPRIDPSCRNPDRFFYWPSRRTLDAPFICEYTPGEPLDPDAVLALPGQGRTGSSGPPLPRVRLATPRPPHVKAGIAPGLGDRPAGGAQARGGPFANLAEQLAEVNAPSEDFDAILQGCGFIEHAVVDRLTLPEPEWRAALSIVARCTDGEDIAHGISQDYPAYTYAETQTMFERLQGGPFACATISQLWSGCKACPHWQKITSPVALGTPVPVPGAAPKPGARRVVNPPPHVVDTERAVADAEARVEQARAQEAVALGQREGARGRYAALKRNGSDDEKASALNARLVAEGDVREAAATRRRAESALSLLRSRKGVGIPEAADPEVWTRLALVGGLGGTLKPADTVANVMRVLQDDDQWADRLTLDAFSLEVCLDGTPLPEELLPDLTAQLGREYTLDTTTGRMRECLTSVAHTRLFHPVRAWLDGLVWDGTPRVETLLFEGFGVDPGPDEALVRTLARRFLLGMLARVYEPGCQLDTMLVLQGRTGLGKSRALEALVGTEWFSRTKLTVGDKDAYMQLRGHWLYEIAEMHDIRRAENAASKSWLSSSIDSYRAPYASNVKKHPRQTVLVGTTEDEQFLTDPLGNRRYWPVTCTRRLDRAWVKEHRAALFAEAVAIRVAGGPLAQYWFDVDAEDTAQLADRTQEYSMEDPWRHAILGWLKTRKTEARFSIEDVLAGALLKPIGDVTQSERTRVGRLLTGLGINSSRERVAGARHTYYSLDESSKSKLGVPVEVAKPGQATGSVSPFKQR